MTPSVSSCKAAATAALLSALLFAASSHAARLEPLGDATESPERGSPAPPPRYPDSERAPQPEIAPSDREQKIAPRDREREAVPDAAEGGREIPALTGPVVDRAGVLSPSEKQQIIDLALELKRKTGAEIAVLTVDSTAPLDPFDYGMAVADRWKLGERGRDNGLLLLVAVDDRKVRFFSGYGLEGILPDGKLGQFLDDEITPRFRAGDYGGGIYAGLRAAAEVIAADAGVRLTGEEPSRPSPRTGEPDGLELLVLLLYLSLFILPFVLASRRRRRGFFPIFFGGGGFGGGFGRGGFGGGGFGGGGFGGGGFGGGGRFGGGGAGRGW